MTRNGPSGLLPKVNRAVEGYIRAFKITPEFKALMLLSTNVEAVV